MAVPILESHSGVHFQTDASLDFVIAAPSGIEAGDLLVAMVSVDWAGGNAWTVPEGWEIGVPKFNNSTYVEAAVFWKEAGGSEPSDYTFTCGTSDGSVFCGGILRISGANVDDPFNVWGTDIGVGNPADCPDVTTTIDDCLILRCFTGDNNTYTNNNTPVGHTVLWATDSSLGNDITSGCAHEDLESQGQPGAGGFTGFDTGRQWACSTVAIAPASAGATAALTGTLTTDSPTEADIRTGGKTLIITLTDDEWTADVGNDHGDTEALIAGIDGDVIDGTGWDAEVKVNMVFGDVTRDSATVVTIELQAEAGYDISATETITVTIPATALVGGVEVEADTTFEITSIDAPTKRKRRIIGRGIGRGIGRF